MKVSNIDLSIGSGNNEDWNGIADPGVRKPQ
jgi:hypothetical protein